MRIVPVVACVALVAGTAHAQQLIAAGSLYGGPSQTRAICYFYNAGTTGVTLTSPELLDQNGTSVSLVIDQCGANLAARHSCGIAANIFNNSTYSCSVVISPTGKNVRGILEVRDVNQNVLKNIELR